MSSSSSKVVVVFSVLSLSALYMVHSIFRARKQETLDREADSERIPPEITDVEQSRESESLPLPRISDDEQRESLRRNRDEINRQIDAQIRLLVENMNGMCEGIQRVCEDVRTEVIPRLRDASMSKSSQPSTCVDVDQSVSQPSTCVDVDQSVHNEIFHSDSESEE